MNPGVHGPLKVCSGCVFAFGCVKGSTPANHSERGLYNSLVQASLRGYEKYLLNRAGRGLGRGIVIMDRRSEAQNRQVLDSAQSSLFSDPEFRKPDVRVTETPLLVPSERYHGIQAADGIGRAVGRSYWYRRLQNPHFKEDHDKLWPILWAHRHSIGNWHSIYVKP